MSRRNHYCREKAIRITCSKCVPVALLRQQAKRMHRKFCHLWPEWPYHIFSNYVIKDTIFGRKKSK
jgi:hypothetical protein